MSDNIAVLDATGTSVTLATTDATNVHIGNTRVTDATKANFMPTMDASARRGYVTITNGTIDLGIFAEDAAHSSAHTGIQILTVRQDTAAALSGTDADYQPLITDGSGMLHVAEGGAALTALQLLDDAVVADDAAFTPATTKVMMAGFQADETATDSVNEGDGGAARMTLDRKVIVTDQPHTSGGLTISRTISAATTNSTSVKGSAGQVYGVVVNNQNAAVAYLKFYNKATAPTVGTDSVVLTFAVQGTSTLNLQFEKGIAFATGIGFGLTTAVADNSTAAVAANELVVNVLYA